MLHMSRREKEGRLEEGEESRMEEEAGTESSKEEEVMARDADGGGATGARGADGSERIEWLCV